MNTVVSNLENLLSLSDEVANRAFSFDNPITETSSINNYFKSMKEIEAEFMSSVSAAKNSLLNMISDIGHFGHNLIYMDGDIQFPDPDNIHNGYMEENY